MAVGVGLGVSVGVLVGVSVGSVVEVEVKVGGREVAVCVGIDAVAGTVAQAESKTVRKMKMEIRRDMRFS